MNDDIIGKICDEILIGAKYDVIDMSWVRQYARDLACDLSQFREILRCVLLRIQTLGIEIGNLEENSTKTFLFFVGWLGTPEEKVARVLAQVENENSDGDYAAWLAYREKVSYYEILPYFSKSQNTSTNP